MDEQSDSDSFKESHNLSPVSSISYESINTIPEYLDLYDSDESDPCTSSLNNCPHPTKNRSLPEVVDSLGDNEYTYIPTVTPEGTCLFSASQEGPTPTPRAVILPQVTGRPFLDIADENEYAYVASNNLQPKIETGVNSPYSANGCRPRFIYRETSFSGRTNVENSDILTHLKKQGWFHGAISRTEAEGRLQPHPDGSYLVRLSESDPSRYSLSLKSPQCFVHLHIVNHEGQFIIGQFSQSFQDIPQMIEYYTVNKLNIFGADHMALLYPVYK